MVSEPSGVLFESVFCQLGVDIPHSLHNLEGGPGANLLAIRLLFRQGRTTGVLLNNPSSAEDQHGPSIYHVERLRAWRGQYCFPWLNRLLSDER